MTRETDNEGEREDGRERGLAADDEPEPAEGSGGDGWVRNGGSDFCGFVGCGSGCGGRRLGD
jgi:hypothetical protein